MVKSSGVKDRLAQPKSRDKLSFYDKNSYQLDFRRGNKNVDVLRIVYACAGCPNKHWNLVTNSISSF